MSQEVFERDPNNCLHVDQIVLHGEWWNRYQCKNCGKKSRWLLNNDYFEINLEDPKNKWSVTNTK